MFAKLWTIFKAIIQNTKVVLRNCTCVWYFLLDVPNSTLVC